MLFPYSHRVSSYRGGTLFELSVLIVMMGVILSMSLPPLSHAIKHKAFKHDLMMLEHLLLLARYRAQHYHHTVTLYPMDFAYMSTGWQKGVKVMDGPQVIFSYYFHTDLLVHWFSGFGRNDHLRFNPLGQVGEQVGHLDVSLGADNPKDIYRFTVSPGGRVRGRWV